jgi:hypothetical protein
LDEEGRDTHRRYQKCKEPNKNGETRKYNITMDLSNICCGAVDLIFLVQDKQQRQTLVNIIMNIINVKHKIVYKTGNSEWLNNW